MYYLQHIVHFGTVVTQYSGGDCYVINMDAHRSGIQLHRSLNPSIVEEIHLNLLRHMAILIGEET